MEYLYYPSFEVNDIDWLKFAMLYFENVKTIMPERGNDTLSDEFKLIIKETGLFGRTMAEYSIVERSTREAIDLLEDVLKRPNLYFNSIKKVKPLELFCNDFTIDLYNEKYTHNLYNYLLQNNFAIETDNGLLVNSFIANLYMSILANNMYNSGKYNLVTDINKKMYDSIINQNHNLNRSLIENEEIKIGFEIQVPNIKQLTIKDIINIRNNDGYIDSIRSFNCLLSDFKKHINNDINRLNIQEFFSMLEEHNGKYFGDKIVNGVSWIASSITAILPLVNNYDPTMLLSTLSGLGIRAHKSLTKCKYKQSRDAYKLVTAISNYKS